MIFRRVNRLHNKVRVDTQRIRAKTLESLTARKSAAYLAKEECNRDRKSERARDTPLEASGTSVSLRIP